MKRLAAAPRWLVALFISLLPIIITFLYCQFWLKVNLFNFTPFYWNDQTWYWHQTLSFSQFGFASGYYLLNEAAAPLTFFKFSSAGPLFPVVYGAIAHFTGWTWFTGIAFNMVLLTVATLIFIHLANLDKKQIIITGLALLVIGPVMYFLPTNSMETFHQAGALILAGLFHRLWMRTMSRRLWWAGLTFFILISLLRFSWVILLPVYFLLWSDRLTLRRVIVALFASGLLAAAIYVGVSLMSSPAHNSILSHVNGMQQGILIVVAALLETAKANIALSFLGGGDLQTALTGQGIQIAIVIIGALVALFPARELRFRTSTKPLEMPFHIYNLTVIILLSLFLYIAGGYYRVFGVHLLLSLLLLIAFRRLTLVGIIIGISALTFSFFNGDNFKQDRSTIETTRHQWSVLMPYQPDFDAWCNTLLVPMELLDGRILNVPAGIGVTFFARNYSPTANSPIRSHYLLLNTDAFQFLNNGHLHVKQLADTPYGTFYINLDTSCARPST